MGARCLLGRGRERSTLRAALEQAARHGRGGVLLIEGSPGSGRTALLHDTLAAANQRMFATLDRPDGVAGLAVHHRDLADLPPGPLIAAVDDLHLVGGGEPALPRLRERTRAGPLVWALTVPAGDMRPEVRRLIAQATMLSRISLGPLAADAVVDLVRQRLGAEPMADLLALVTGAGGNPLLITELVEGLRDERLLEIRDGRAGLASHRLPHRVHEVVRYWFSVLSPQAQQLLQIAATIGETFSVETIAHMQGNTTAGLLPAINEVTASGLLRAAGEQMAFTHKLVWRAIADNVPPSVRHALRRQANSHEPAPAEGATDAVALMPALLLARTTLSRPLTGAMVERLRALLVSTPVTCSLGGSSVDPAGDGATGVGDAGPSTTSVQLVLGLFGDDDAAVVAAARAVIAAHPPGHADADLLAAASVLSNLSWAAGRLAEGLRWGREAVRMCAGPVPPTWRPYPRLALAAKLAEIGQVADAERLVGEAREEITRDALAGHQAPPLVIQARILLQAGRTSDAYERAQAGLALAADSHGGWVTPYAQAVLALVALRLGNVTTAADHVWRCHVGGADTVVFRSVRVAWCEFGVAVAQVGAHRAMEILVTRHADLLTQRSLYLEEAGAAPWLVRLALADSRVALAASVAATAELLAAENPAFDSLRISAVHARGLLDKDMYALRLAAAGHRDVWAAALAYEDLGLLAWAEHGPGDRQGTEPLREALSRFEYLGARPDATRVRELLRSNAPPPRAEPAVDVWHGVSDTAQAIARLVSEGLTNRQVARRVSLSPHTVNYHLRALFRRFGVNSRVELARFVANSHRRAELDDFHR